MRRCRDCNARLTQQAEKALDGEWALVWGDDEGDWVCPVTGNEHAPVEVAAR